MTPFYLKVADETKPPDFQHAVGWAWQPCTAADPSALYMSASLNPHPQACLWEGLIQPYLPSP